VSALIRIRQRRLLAKREERWSKSYNAYSQVVKQLQEEEGTENRRAVRIGVAVGVVLHIILFIIVFPEVEQKIYRVGQGARVYRMKQFRFQPPKQTQTRRSAPTKKTKRIPIPDPTPDDPEPIYHEDVITPDVDFFSDQEFLEGIATIPDGPPGSSTGPMQISGNVRAPERIYAPDPVYPEEARQARVQGVVILQTIIDNLGKVTNVKVLKGLPSGLTEAAVEAVSQWKFNPATLEGKPVSVYYMVTITFSVQ
jgi:TonB family protein